VGIWGFWCSIQNYIFSLKICTKIKDLHEKLTKMAPKHNMEFKLKTSEK
jgi:hypothetical protein